MYYINDDSYSSISFFCKKGAENEALSVKPAKILLLSFKMLHCDSQLLSALTYPLYIFSSRYPIELIKPLIFLRQDYTDVTLEGKKANHPPVCRGFLTTYVAAQKES